MKKILALLISLIFIVTLSMTIGCPKKEEPTPPPAQEAPAPAAPAAPEKPAEAPPAAPEKAPEKK